MSSVLSTADSLIEMRVGSGENISGSDVLGGWKLHSSSARVRDSLNPVFPEIFYFDYFFEEVQNLCFVVVDMDKSSTDGSYMEENDYLGHATVSLAQLASTGTRGCTFNLVIDSEKLPRGLPHFKKYQKRNETTGKTGNSSISFVTTSEADLRKKVMLTISCHNLDRKDFNGLSDPFFTISRVLAGGNKNPLPIYKSPILKKTINPTWSSLVIPFKNLTPSGNRTEPLCVSVWDWDEKGGEDFIGSFDTTLESLMLARNIPLINPKKAKGLSSMFYKNSGLFSVISGSLIDEPSFLDYIVAGAKINLAVAVDLTASNQYPHHSTSLHHFPELLKVNDGNGNLVPPISSQLAFGNQSVPFNEYQAAIAGLGQIIQEYDSDKIFPLYGFGFERLGVRQRCALFGDCHGVKGLLSTYKSVICDPDVRLSGPTDFAPVIRSATMRLRQEMKDLKENQIVYHILLIITDGLITDINDTLAELVNASTLPISIVVVGVGGEDFSMMKLLDGDDGNGGWRNLPDGRKARDIVQFVAMRNVQGNPFALARETLAEIPGQFLEYVKANTFNSLT